MKQKSKFAEDSFDISININQVEHLKNLIDLDHSQSVTFSNCSKKSLIMDGGVGGWIFEEPANIKLKQEEKYGAEQKELMKKLGESKRNTMYV